MEFIERQTIEWQSAGYSYQLRYDALELSFFRDGTIVFELPSDEAKSLAYILSHIYGIRRLKATVEGAENAGKPWTSDMDAELTQMFHRKISALEMAKHFNRSRGGIASRLARLGLIERRDKEI